MKLGQRPPLAIDFDGTFAENVWPQLGAPRPGAVEAMLELQKFTKPFIFTSRVAPMEVDNYTPRHPSVVAAEIQKITDLLESCGLYGIEVWHKPWKPSALAYIDDKALRYPGRDNSWRAMVEQVKAIYSIEDKKGHL